MKKFHWLSRRALCQRRESQWRVLCMIIDNNDITLSFGVQAR
jgi:hypothetical protein